MDDSQNTQMMGAVDMSQMQGGMAPGVASVPGGAVQGGMPMPPGGGMPGMGVPMPGGGGMPGAGGGAPGGIRAPGQDGGGGVSGQDGGMMPGGGMPTGDVSSMPMGGAGPTPGMMGQPVADMGQSGEVAAMAAPGVAEVAGMPQAEQMNIPPMEAEVGEAPAMPDPVQGVDMGQAAGAEAVLDANMTQGADVVTGVDVNAIQASGDAAVTDTAQTPGDIAAAADAVQTPSAGVVDTDVADADTEQTSDQAQAAADAEIAATAGQTYASADIAAAAAEASTPTAVPDQVKIETLLEECVRQKASDLHIQVGLPPILRVDGALTPIPNTPVLTADMVEKLIFATLDSMQREVLSKDKEFDYSFSFGEVARFRVNAFNERGNLAAAFRLIPTEMPTIEQLGMPQVVTTFADYPRGLVLVTGPTGSGKSTTLAALINKINTEKAVHIITVEDPVEFTHRSKRSVVVQREVHYDTFSFARALKSILREDPDVVLVGEMRDLETISAAITIAETGHLVFATLHTNSAAQSIDRMIDVFPAHQQPQIRSQLSNILMAICAQRLVPAIDGGRVVAAEIMVANPAVRSIIREGKTHQLDTTIQTGASEGMQTMDRTLAKLVQTGVVTYDAAHEFAVDVKEFERLAKG